MTTRGTDAGGKGAGLTGLILARLRKLPGLLRVLGGAFAYEARHHGFRAALRYAACDLHKRYVKFMNERSRAPRVECPCCGWTGYDFDPLYGVGFWIKRETCPKCGSSSRHRGVQVYLTRHENAVERFQGLLVNFAPEAQIFGLFANQPRWQYVAADLALFKLEQARGRAVQVDISHTPIRDACADVVVCFHLLEHLQDERPAIEEIRRILKPGGVAYIMVPIDLRLTESTYFGKAHPDYFYHFWSHGLDFKEKLRAFECEEVWPRHYMSPEEQFRYSVPDKEIIHRCAKPVAE